MQTISSIITVILLEENQNNCESIEHFLREINFQKFEFIKPQQLEDGLNYLQQSNSDIALVNLNLASINNLNIPEKIYAITPKIPIIFLTANDAEKTVIQKNILAIELRSGNANTLEKWAIQDYLIKDKVSTVLLEKSIYYVLEQKKVREKLQQVQQTNLQLQSQLQDTQELFKTVVDTTSALMWMTDTQENYTFLNQAWLSFSGQTLATGLKENWRDRIHPKDLAQCNEAYQSALKKCQGFQIEYRLRRFDDTYRTMLNTAVRRHNSKGEFAGLLCSCLDITQRKKIEQQVIQQAQTDRILAEITQNIHSSLELDVILQTAVEEVNQFLLADKIFITKIVEDRRLTLSFESGLVNSCSSCEISGAKRLPTEEELVRNFERLSQGEIITQNNTLETNAISDSDFESATSACLMLLVPIISQGKLWGLLCVEQNCPPRYWQLEEIKLLKRVAIQLGIAIKQSELYQQLEQANKNLEELAVIDSLTKIANRRKFDQYLATEWKRLTREKNPLSLILCDVDHFKLYNDTYGHQAGDRCLRKVAQAISKAIKRPADLVARYGGEEFAVVLPNTNVEGAKYLAQQIRLQVEAIKIPHINSPVDLYITLSLGVASCIPIKDTEVYGLVAAADQGLYQAKERGRNQVVQFEIEPE